MQAIETFHTTASAEAVWHVLADVEHWKDWTPTVLEISPLDGKEIRVGARFRITQPGIKPAVYEVTACTPHRAFTWRQSMPGGGLIADHKVSGVDGQTTVELRFYSKGLIAGIASALFSSKIRQFVATEGRSLKQRCEGLNHA